LSFFRIKPHPPSLARGWVWAVWPWLIAAMVIFQKLNPVWENDVFLHVRLGEWILNGGGPAGDPRWTFGPFESGWINTLAPVETMMALLWRVGGYALIAAAAAILAGAVTVAVWWALSALAPDQAKESPGPARAAILIQLIVLMALFDGLRERPQLFSLLLLPVLGVWAVKVAVTGKYPKPWWVAALVLPWAWLHGYALLVAPVLFLAGLAYVFGSDRTAYKEAMKKVAFPAVLTVGVATAATLLTPAGIGVYVAAFRLRAAASDLIAEWLPTDFAMWQTWLVFVLVAMWVWGAFLSVAKPDRTQNFWVSLRREAFLLLGVLLVFMPTARTTLVAAILIGLLAGYRLMIAWGDIPPRPWEIWKPSRLVKIVLCAPVIAAVAWSGVWVTQHQGLRGIQGDFIPVALFEEIAGSPGPHNILIDYNISGAARAVIPDARTSIDGRVDRYGPRGAYNYYWGLTRGLGVDWADQLAAYREANMAVLLEDSPLRQILLDNGWTVAGSGKGADGTYLWLVQGAQGKPIIEIAAKYQGGVLGSPVLD